MRKNKQVPRIVWPLIALGIILLYNLLFLDGFFHISVKDGHLFGSMIDILRRSAPTLIMAVAMTYVIATGGIDISVGSILAISGSIASLVVWGGQTEYLATTSATFAAPLFNIILIPLLVAILLGAFNGVMVAMIGLQPFIATLILMTAGRGLAQLITGGKVLNFRHAGFEFIGRGYFLGLPFPFILALLILLIGVLITRFTPMGLYIQAVGGNPSASRLSGVNTRAVLLFVYMFSGFAAGTSGLIMTSDIAGADAGFMGLYMELDAILAVVIGGTPMEGGKFSVGGTVVGVLIIQTLTTTILTKGIPTEYTLLVKAIVVVAVLIIQSERMREMLAKSRAKAQPAGEVA